MALNRKELVTLGITTAKASRSAATAFSYNDKQFSYSDLNDTFRNELKEYCKDYYSYQENKNVLFQIMAEIADDVLPKKVLDQWGMFAEIKTYAQGDKPVFTQRITAASKRRAKQFVTKVGLAGIYEVFKLDGTSLEVPVTAIGGAAQIGFEEFLDGKIDLADVLDVIMEGIDETIYVEIEKALKAAVSTIQPANKVTQAGFNEASMDNLLQVVDSYGKAAIYCTFEFAAKMMPASSANWSDAMKDNMWNNGAPTQYKNHPIIILPNSFTDETNATKVIDPKYAWILPTGIEKPIKIAFEGQTIVREYENKDLSREIQMYKKIGVAAMVKNNMGVYVNTSL